MKRFSVILLLLLAVLSATLLVAKHSDSYPFGSYSYLQHTSDFYRKNSELLAAKLQELGFNITVMDTNNNDKNVSELLAILDKYGVDAMLTDKSWSNDPKDMRSYALVGLSTSNYQRFEAEFVDGTAVKPEDINSSVYWYGTVVGENNKHLPARIGKVEADNEASYEHIWKCIPGRDAPGYAYTDITYRWKNNHGNARKLADEFRIYNTHKDRATDTDSVYFRFRIKLSNFKAQLRSDAPLIGFFPTGYLGKPTEFSTPAQLSVENNAAPSVHFGKTLDVHSIPRTTTKLGTKPNNSLFTYADYLALGSPTGYFELEFAISYNQLRETGLLTGDIDYNPNSEDSWWWLVMRGVSPRLYWHGNCELSLDYVDIEDQMYRNLRTKPDFYREKINQRLRDFTKLPHGDIIKHFYTMDEPFQPNLASFKELQALIDPSLPTPISTIYDIVHREHKMNDGVTYYDHVDLARNFVQPPIIMTDIYPIKPGINFNPKNPNFLQDVLDHRLVKNYRECKTYALAKPGRKFYPVTQAFGFWDTKQWLSWLQPPSATQRALLYLPLCYQPDGFFNYRLFGFVQASGHGEYASVKAMPDGTFQSNSYIWDVVKLTNPRVKQYAEMMKSLTWLGAGTAMPKATATEAKVSSAGIGSVRVSKSTSGSYKGYIECGYYTEKQGSAAIFAVNRRTDYFTGKKKEAYRNSNLVPPDRYPDYYKEFGPQTLRVETRGDAHGTHPALFDPLDKVLYPGKKNQIDVELNAGEGKFLKLVSSLPAKVNKGIHRLGKQAYLAGAVVVNSKAEISCEGDLILLPGTSLTLKKGSKLVINGRLIKMENASVNLEGGYLSSRD